MTPARGGTRAATARGAARTTDPAGPVGRPNQEDTMVTTITRMFDTYEHATQAVRELETSGIAHDDISIVANNTEGRYGDAATGTTSTATTTGDLTSGTTTGTTSGTTYGTSGSDTVSDDTSTGAGTGATLGTVLGGGAGLLAGLGMLAIPGVGPIVAAGWLVASLTGAGVGAAAGGLLGSLVGAGVSEEDAHTYAEGVRRGGTLVTVRADEGQRSMVEAVLDRYSPVDVTTRREEYRTTGWERFDENAPAYTAGASTMAGSTGTGANPPGYTAGGMANMGTSGTTAGGSSGIPSTTTTTTTSTTTTGEAGSGTTGGQGTHVLGGGMTPNTSRT